MLEKLLQTKRTR